MKQHSDSIRVGVDIGGTFTDVVAVMGERKFFTVKTPSIPADPVKGVVEGLILLAGIIGVPLRELLSETELFIHGTTIATNSLIERKGAKVGMITTEGFRDILELREGTKGRRYDLHSEFPQPLIHRPWRREVKERIGWNGRVLSRLDEDAVRKELFALRAAGVDAVVVGFLHSHINPIHELRVRSIIHEMDWATYVVLSHEILAIEGEYDRFSTAAVNAYVGPKLSQYLLNLERRLHDADARLSVLIMQSTGGLLPVVEASRYAVGCITSGPAGGAVASALFGRLNKRSNIVAYDTGGTTTDISLIVDGVPIERTKTQLEDAKISIPSIDIQVIGLGGGSLARIDAGGILTLGPDSAGAHPGPASYGRGGKYPTLTDANLMLGYLSEDTFLGGRFALYANLAHESILNGIAGPLGLSVEDASLAIHTLASSRIAEGIRSATIRRGLDPRDFALISFGGAGGAHTDAVSRELSIPMAIVPREAAVFSAFGFLAADVRLDSQRSCGKLLSEMSPNDLVIVFGELESKMRKRLEAIGFGPSRIRFDAFLDCRYLRQVSTIEVKVSEQMLEQQDFSALVAAYENTYRRYYGHVHANEAPFVESCRLSGYGLVSAVPPPQASTGDVPNRPPKFKEHRRVYTGTWIEAPVYWFDDLVTGTELNGLAIIESSTTTVLLQSGSQARVDEYGSLQLVQAPKA